MLEFKTSEELLNHYAAVKARINKSRAPIEAVDQVEEEVVCAPVELPDDTELDRVLEELANVPAVFPTLMARRIVADTALEFGVSVESISGEARMKCFVEARKKVCWRLSRELGWSLPRIGRWVNRDHTTVLHAVRMYDLEQLHKRAGYKPPKRADFCRYYGINAK